MNKVIADLDCKIKIHLGTIRRKNEEVAAELEPIREKIRELRIEKLKQETGFNIGDLIKVGRNGGFQARITSIECDQNDSDYGHAYWMYAKLKKDGSISKLESRLYFSDSVTLVEKCEAEK